MTAILLAAILGAPAQAEYFVCEAPPRHPQPEPPPRPEIPRWQPGVLEIELLGPAPEWVAPPEPAPEPPAPEPTGAGGEGEEPALYSAQEKLIGEGGSGHDPEATFGSAERRALWGSAENTRFFELAHALPVRAYADGHSLRAVAAALSEATGLTIAVSPAVAERQVFLATREGGLDFVLASLQDIGASVTYANESLQLGAYMSVAEGWEDADSYALRSILSVPVPGDQATRQALAQTICWQLAGEGGRVGVLGESLVIRDTEASLVTIREWLREVSSEEGAPPAKTPPRRRGRRDVVTPTEPPLRCEGASRSRASNRDVSVPEVALGPLELRVVEAAPAGGGYAASMDALLTQTRLQVSADGASLGALGMALSQALGVDVRVYPEDVTWPVFVYAPDASPVQVLTALEEHGLSVSREGARGLTISAPPSRAWRLYPWHPPQPAETLTLHVPEGPIAPAEFAQFWCDFGASERASAAVYEDAIVLRAPPDELDWVRMAAPGLLGEDVRFHPAAAE